MKLLVTVFLLFFLSSHSTADDGMARETAMSWLSLIDNGDYLESWEQAGAYFQQEVPSAQWQEAVSEVRDPLGSVISRQQVESKTYQSLPGVPEGEYLVLRFSTRFTHQAEVIETLTLQSVDGDWKVLGYFVR